MTDLTMQPATTSMRDSAYSVAVMLFSTIAASFQSGFAAPGNDRVEHSSVPNQALLPLDNDTYICIIER